MSADLRPIRTDADHEAALAEAARLWGAKIGTPDGDRLDILAILIDVYETRSYPMDPIEAIKFRMEQLGITRKDLEPLIGTRGACRGCVEPQTQSFDRHDPEAS